MDCKNTTFFWIAKRNEKKICQNKKNAYFCIRKTKMTNGLEKAIMK